MTFDHRAALVTGANRGLGFALVASLLAAGADRVYATGRRSADLADVVALDPARVVPLVLDITSGDEILAAVIAASDVTLLINNAGVLDFAGPLEVDAAILERNMAVNFRGTFDVTRAFVPTLARNVGGNVANILTFLTYVSAPVFSAYNAAKAASWSMSLSLRPLLLARGVKVTNVFPTTIDTRMVADLAKAKDTPAAVAEAIVRGIAEGQEDIYPMGAAEVFAAWRADQKSIERRFGKIV